MWPDFVASNKDVVTRREFSISLDAKFPDDLAVLFIIFPDEAVEIVGRQHERLQATGNIELFGKIRTPQQVMYPVAQGGDNRFGRVGRGKYTKPDVDGESGVEFADCRQVGKALCPLFAARCQRAQLAGLDERRTGGAGKHNFGVAGNRRLGGWSRAAKRHMQEVDAGPLFED